MIALFFDLFFFLSLNAQETAIANPLDHFVGTWKVLSKSADEKTEPKILYYGQAKKMEAGYGIHFVFYKTFENELKDPMITVNWAYHPESKKVYGYNPTANGVVYRVEGTIESNGNLRLEGHRVGMKTDNQEYGVYAWTFLSNNHIHFKSSNYKDGKEVSVNLEADVMRITPQNRSPEEMLNRAYNLNFAKYLIIYKNGKTRGLSAKEIAQEVIGFYNWRPNTWPTKPQDIIGGLQTAQAPHRAGYFEILEDRPGKVKFIMGRYWRDWFNQYGANLGLDEKGLIQGVSKDDIETQYRSWLEHFCYKDDKNWKLQIEEQGELKWVITISAK